MYDYTDRGATFSADGRHRYRLWREWRGTHDPKHWRWWEEKGKPVVDGAGAPLGEPKACVFVMLNPSIANATRDDPTITRCVGFARRWRYERLEVVNLFAAVATVPADILRLDLGAAVGLDNCEYVEKVVGDAGLVICAWGRNGAYLGQDQTVLGWFPYHVKPYCLGVTDNGQPKHPLYLPGDTKLRLYRPRIPT